MYRYWRPKVTLSGCRFAAGALLFLLGAAVSARAAVTAVGDPEDGYGVAPNVFTVDPASPDFGGPYASGIARGIAGDRRLRQTFQNATAFNVGQINISFDVSGGSSVGSANDTGLRLAFYQVDDVLASAWLPGTLVKEITLQPGNMPAADLVLRLNLTGGDVFSLPQRNGGSAGYGLEISTPNALSSDGNPGLIRFTNNSASDYYAGGRYYVEGGASNAYRDFGLSLLGSSEAACDPGDVNCDTFVNEVDLGIIAANFRKSGGRELGDLTGNGFIDFDDFGQWKTVFTGGGGSLVGIDLSFASVPEPSSVLFAIAGLLLVPVRLVRSQTR